MQPAAVVKVGGSLREHVGEIARLLEGSRVTSLIVPGGGAIADHVQGMGVGDDESHWMAIASMDIYGWYLASFGLPTVTAIAVPPRPAVLLPYCELRRRDPLPHSWDVTSDTIAAYVAGELRLPLILLKSVDGILAGGSLIPVVTGPVPTEVTDPCLIPYVLSRKIPTRVINGAIPGRIAAALSGIEVEGTVIRPPFK